MNNRSPLSIVIIFISTSLSSIGYGKEMSAHRWPKQPNPPLFSYSPTIFSGEPPFEIGQRFRVKNYALFFKNPECLYYYNKFPKKIDYLIRNGSIKQLSNGRLLTATERITSFSGKVRDEEFGDGYVIIPSRL